MDPALFLADLEAKPQALGGLADALQGSDPWATIPETARRIVLLGMGSSHYANAVAAARLRRHGVDAVAELASSDLHPPATADTYVVAVSATGESRETLDAVRRYRDASPVTALTNAPDSGLAGVATDVVPLLAGPELGGVVCRTFQHTLLLLLALESRLTGGALDLAALTRASAAASADLLDRRRDWLPELRDLLLGPDGTHVAAPARRLSSAQQAALMLREGPRRPATGCETGDWSHVDVYLTKTTDYRLLLYPGSAWEDELLRWCGERGSTVVAVGADQPRAAMSLRYNGDDDDDVRLVTEVLVAELLAQSAWADQGTDG